MSENDPCVICGDTKQHLKVMLDVVHADDRNRWIDTICFDCFENLTECCLCNNKATEHYCQSCDLRREHGQVVYNDVPRKQPTRQQKYLILKRQKWRCNICNCVLAFSKEHLERVDWADKQAIFDHIHPYSERFSYVKGAQNINEFNNFQALCFDCNIKKRDKKIN